MFLVQKQFTLPAYVLENAFESRDRIQWIDSNKMNSPWSILLGLLLKNNTNIVFLLKGRGDFYPQA